MVRFERFTHYKKVPGSAHYKLAFIARLKWGKPMSYTTLLCWWCKQPSATIGRDVKRPKTQVPEWFPEWLHHLQDLYRDKTHKYWLRHYDNKVT